MITNDLKFKNILERKILISLYNCSLAGAFGVSDYNGCIEKQYDKVWLLDGHGELLCGERIYIIRDEYIPEDDLSNMRAIDNLARRLSRHLQADLDQEILDAYPLISEKEFGFAAQLFIKFGELKGTGKTVVEMELIYGHKDLQEK